jgi:hypothetical protein
MLSLVEAFVHVMLDSGLQAIGWAVLKVVTFGRYKGFQPEDILLEGSVGLATIAAVFYGAYRLIF